MRGKPERDMVSLRMMGWGLVVVENSSAVTAAAVASPGWGVVLFKVLFLRGKMPREGAD